MRNYGVSVISVHRRPITSAIALAALLAAPPAATQTEDRWALCGAPLLPPIAAQPGARDASGTGIRIRADQGEMRGNPPMYQFRGNATLTRADQTLSGEQLSYDTGSGQVVIEQGARLRETGLLIEGRRASYWLDDNRGRFEGVRDYRIAAGHLQGSAETIIRQDASLSRYRGVTLSTCMPGAEVWQLSATTATIDNTSRQGRAWNAVLSIHDLPVFYAPYLQFPVGDERLSGFLAPTIGQSTNNGTTVSLPWYWNIAPNYDATITPTSYWKRGLLTDVEFRYLERWLEGEVKVSHLPDDDRYGDDRWALDQEHQLRIGDALRGELHQQRTSDPSYSDDFGDEFNYRSARFLESDARLSWDDGPFSVSIDTQYWQRVDPDATESSQPLAREPRLQLDYSPLAGAGPLRWSVAAETVEFTHPDAARTQGRRTDLAPRLSLPWRRLGYFIEPAVSWRYTEYDLTGDLPGDSSTPDRSMPIYSLDAGVFLERPSTLFEGVYQTLEPRLFYRRAPSRDQADLPDFDSSAPTLTYSSMFRENGFTGVDRIEDGERVTLGVTSRFIDSVSGREYLRASAGQVFYTQDRSVAPAGETERDRSDVITELRLSLPAGFSARADYRWDPENSGNTSLLAEAGWRGANDTLVNLALRQREVDGESTLEQASTSLTLPVARGWRVFAGLVEDLEASETRERFLGIQQSGCCHALRLVSRETLQRNASLDAAELEREIMLEIELRGLGGIGDRIQGFLDTEIDGYNPGR